MAQADFFLKLDGITGESQDKVHVDEIQLYSVTFGVSNHGVGGFGKGSGAAKSDVHDIIVTKLTDKSTPELFKKCATGKHIDSGILTLRKAGGDAPVEYLVIKLTEVFISQFNVGASDSGGIAQETVGLNFSKIELDYTPQNADGTAAAAVTGSWNIKTSEAG